MTLALHYLVLESEVRRQVTHTLDDLVKLLLQFLRKMSKDKLKHFSPSKHS